MKRKVISIVICALILFLTSSCVATDKQVKAEKHTFLYSAAEDNYILDETRSTLFDTFEYSDSKAPQQISKTILDTEYTLTYEKSAVLPMSDISVHNYKIDGLNDARLLVDSTSGAVVKYVNFPYNKTIASEEEYLEFVRELFPAVNDSNFNYKCKTHSYYRSETETRSTVEDGFLLPNESRTIGTYYFFFTQPIEESIEANRHISATFNSDTFSLEFYDLEYTKEAFEYIFNSLEEINNNLISYVKENIKSEYVFRNCDVVKQTLFIKNGKPYLKSTLLVTFGYSNISCIESTTNIQIITDGQDLK